MMTRTRCIVVLAALLGLLFAAPTAFAQVEPNVPLPGPIDEINPLGVLTEAADALPGTENGLSSAINIVILLTVLSLAPSILVLCTCFTRLIIVLGLLRQALGTQGLPPGQVLTGLSLFLTMVIMAPTFEQMWANGIGPYSRGEIKDYRVAWDETKAPLRTFMFDQIEATNNWSSVRMMMNYRGIDTSRMHEMTRADVDMLTLVPAYVLSELKTSFLIGFRVYLPFLVIDMVIASMLISMGMLMLPPVLISLPFKMLLFVLVDGWQLIVGTLMMSFSVTGEVPPGTEVALHATFDLLGSRFT